MSLMIYDETVATRLIEERRANGLDRLDEVWNGVYVMSPLANNEHQQLTTELAAVLLGIVQNKALGRVFAGANVSDQEDDWTNNYRVPDVLVFLQDTQAEDRNTHWFGGPEFAIEVVSEGDQTLKKLAFYASVNTQELLVVDRHPWKLTLYRRHGDDLRNAEVSSFEDASMIRSDVIPVGFALQDSPSAIRVTDFTENRSSDILVKRSDGDKE